MILCSLMTFAVKSPYLSLADTPRCSYDSGSFGAWLATLNSAIQRKSKLNSEVILKRSGVGGNLVTLVRHNVLQTISIC